MLGLCTRGRDRGGGGAQGGGGVTQASTWGKCAALLQLINPAFHQRRDKDVQIRTHLDTKRVSKIKARCTAWIPCCSYRCYCNLLYVLVRPVHQTFSIADLSNRSDRSSCMLCDMQQCLPIGAKIDSETGALGTRRGPLLICSTQ